MAVTSLGGDAIALGPDEVGLGRREGAADVARNLSRLVDAIVLRTFAHDTLTEMAAAASVPVVNALTDAEHPCQALADLLTLRRRFGRLHGLSLAFVGDGNNVAHSLMLAGALAGLDVRIATPPGYEPDPAVIERARALGARNIGRGSASGPIRSTPSTGADAVYTDVWTSMGREAEAKERRARFAGFEVERIAPGARGAARGGPALHAGPPGRGDRGVRP